MAERYRAFFAAPFNEQFRWVRNAVATACRQLDVDFHPVDEMVGPGEPIVETIRYEIRQSHFAFALTSSPA